MNPGTVFVRTRSGAVVVSMLTLSGAAVGQQNLTVTVDSRVAAGSNHAAAHIFRTGAGVNVGVVEYGDDATTHGIIAGNLGARLGNQWNFRNLQPGFVGPPAPAAGNDNHATLVSSCLAGNNTANMIGVAPGARIFLGTIGSTNGGNDDYESLRYGTSYLRLNHNTNLMNMSFRLFPGNSPNGQFNTVKYLDWFQNRYDALMCKSAGNRGHQPNMAMTNYIDDDKQITDPGDTYNGITVGATDNTFTTRATYSSYRMLGDNGNQPDGRGKPDIVAPGTGMDDNLSYPVPANTRPNHGTSFAAPHVSGTAALLVENGLTLGGGPGGGARPPSNHTAVKALILNSARKRGITGTNAGNSTARDYAGGFGLVSRTDQETSDEDYLNGGALRIGATPANGVPPNATANWTPSQWFKNPGPFDPFFAQRPLDDEQGTGLLDSRRALTNMIGGEQQPSVISGIGWDRDTVGATAGGLTKSYDFNIHIPAGSFITATLCWDRLIEETNAANGQVDEVDLNDIYDPMGGIVVNGLADLDLLFRYHGALGNFLIAGSISVIDNVEHLHIPTSFNILPGELSIDVRLANAHGLGNIDYGLAWWTVPTPGTASFLALAGFCAAGRRRRS